MNGKKETWRERKEQTKGKTENNCRRKKMKTKMDH